MTKLTLLTKKSSRTYLKDEVQLTKDKLESFCLDDDVGLELCFTETKNVKFKTEVDHKILNIHRVSCFWQKTGNFNKYTATLKFPQDEEQKYKTYFKIMVITRDQQVFKFYHEKLEKNEKIKKYIR